MNALTLLAAWRDFCLSRSPISCSNSITHDGHVLVFEPERHLKNGALRVRCYSDHKDIGMAEFTPIGTVRKMPGAFALAGFPHDAGGYYVALKTRLDRLQAAFATEDIEV